jgi:hypothetical protein
MPTQQLQNLITELSQTNSEMMMMMVVMITTTTTTTFGAAWWQNAPPPHEARETDAPFGHFFFLFLGVG